MADEGGFTIAAPGRVNLIGEHIDYHGLPVLPMALRRSVRVTFRPRADRRIRMVGAPQYGVREFEWTHDLQPVMRGDWENYLRAAAQLVGGRWGIGVGIDAEVDADLPAAAGLSSSTALIVATSLALLNANGLAPSFAELMEVLPDGEHFVGTRGGGMDHAACLASEEGCASLIRFDPVSLRPIPVPANWGFLVAHSLVTAEKSGGAREAYNARRKAGSTALSRLGFASYRQALDAGPPEELAARLPTPEERDSFLHVTTEALRVVRAVEFLSGKHAGPFGALLLESHASLRDRLHVSCPALDRLVECAMESGAIGARLTGAGFGGCVVALAEKSRLAAVRDGLIRHYYSQRPEFDEERHLIDAEPGPGVLRKETHAAPHH